MGTREEAAQGLWIYHMLGLIGMMIIFAVIAGIYWWHYRKKK